MSRFKEMTELITQACDELAELLLGGYSLGDREVNLARRSLLAKLTKEVEEARDYLEDPIHWKKKRTKYAPGEEPRQRQDSFELLQRHLEVLCSCTGTMRQLDSADMWVVCTRGEADKLCSLPPN